MAKASNIRNIKHYAPKQLNGNIGRAVSNLLDAFPRVTHIADLKEPLLIRVGKAEVDTAEPKDPAHCAFANACAATFGCKAFVSLRSVYLIFGHIAVRGITTELLRREITDNDRYRKFTPGTYRVAAITPSTRIGVRSADRNSGHDYPRRGRKRTGVVHSVGVRA